MHLYNLLPERAHVLQIQRIFLEVLISENYYKLAATSPMCSSLSTHSTPVSFPITWELWDKKYLKSLIICMCKNF